MRSVPKSSIHGELSSTHGSVARGHSANERLAALGGAAPSMPEVPRGRSAENSGVAGFRYNDTENGEALVPKFADRVVL